MSKYCNKNKYSVNVIIHFKDKYKMDLPMHSNSMQQNVVVYSICCQSCEWDVEHSSEKAKHLLPQPGHCG